MIRPGIGYIHVTSFMETTCREVGDALDKFGDTPGPPHRPPRQPRRPAQRSRQHVRQVPPEGPDRRLAARTRLPRPGLPRPPRRSDAKYPIVVLVNRNTASAAEIVSGALQDHDRALIVGETTFGKGLVQTVFPISENTGLALTTYHYYTPSGRLIQRNYDHVSLYDYYYVRDDATQPKDNANREVKLTDSGRTVYGGGGITPDEKIDNLQVQPLPGQLSSATTPSSTSPSTTSPTTPITKDFVVDDAVLQQFKDFLKTEKIDYTDADFADNIDWVKASIKSELFTSQFGQLEGLKVRAEWDPQINKALTFMPEAQALENHTLPSQQQKTQTASR